MEQTKNIRELRTNCFCVIVRLNPARGIAQIEKWALGHVAMPSDAPIRATRVTFLKLVAHLGDRSVYMKGGTEWIDTFGAELVEFFASQRDQLIFIFHLRQRM